MRENARVLLTLHVVYWCVQGGNESPSMSPPAAVHSALTVSGCKCTTQCEPSNTYWWCLVEEQTCRWDSQRGWWDMCDPAPPPSPPSPPPQPHLPPPPPPPAVSFGLFVFHITLFVQTRCWVHRMHMVPWYEADATTVVMDFPRSVFRQLKASLNIALIIGNSVYSIGWEVLSVCNSVWDSGHCKCDVSIYLFMIITWLNIPFVLVPSGSMEFVVTKCDHCEHFHICMWSSYFARSPSWETFICTRRKILKLLLVLNQATFGVISRLSNIQVIHNLKI